MTTARHHVARWIAIAVLVAILVGVVLIARSAPPAPGAFYDPPSPLPPGPMGEILRIEPLADLPNWVTGWKVLYRSTGFDGSPTAVSGMVLVPNSQAPAAGRRVVVWTHGTSGVASNCAPSIGDGAALPSVKGADVFLQAGYAVVTTDYQGLGTPGPHPYLVGVPAGRNALDAVRAARAIPDAHAGGRFAVWGHSQGGHSALFTGQQAKAGYAPELELVGVAAAAPPTDLAALMARDVGSLAGNVLTSFAIESWTKVYRDPTTLPDGRIVPGATLDQIVERDRQGLVAHLGTDCIETELQTLDALPEAAELQRGFLSAKPWEIDPWQSLTTLNRPTTGPGTAIGVPMLVLQGTADTLVWPDVTAAFVKDRCEAGETLSFVPLEGVDHPGAAFAAIPDVVAWVDDRFDDGAPPTNCADLPSVPAAPAPS